MIFDIHSHLLPWLDDGSTSMEDSVQLVRDQIEDGITEMILTPHYRLDWFHYPKERVAEVYGEFTEAIRKEGLEMITHLGMEAHDDPKMPEHVINGDVLTLCGTEYFLLEMDWRVHNLNIVNDVNTYMKAGFRPIIVHYERFRYKNVEEVTALREAGALFQINGYSLLACESEENRDFAFGMLDNGIVDFVATDYHVGKFRKTKEAYALIGERYGEAVRDDLFYNRAKALFGTDR